MTLATRPGVQRRHPINRGVDQPIGFLRLLTNPAHSGERPIQHGKHLLGVAGVQVPLDFIEDAEQLKEALIRIVAVGVILVVVRVAVIEIDIRQRLVDLPHEVSLDGRTLRRRPQLQNPHRLCAGHCQLKHQGSQCDRSELVHVVDNGRVSGHLSSVHSEDDLHASSMNPSPWPEATRGDRKHCAW